MPREILTEQGFKLRFLRPEDAEGIYEIFQADPMIQSYVTWTAGLENAEDVRRAIEEFQSKQSLRYAITDEDSVVGYIGIWKDRGYFTGKPAEGEYGFGYFVDPAERGRGIVTSAAKALTAEAERVFPIEIYSLYIEDGNLASQAVARKLGFGRTDTVVEEPKLHCLERRWEKTISSQ